MSMTTKQAGQKRWKGVSVRRRKELMKTASRKYWDSLTPEQRSAEMKRRAAKRKKKKPANS
jgi:Spy/CpxP family protein refolding chaperone